MCLSRELREVAIEDSRDLGWFQGAVEELKHKGIEKPSEGRYNGFLTALFWGWSIILLKLAE